MRIFLVISISLIGANCFAQLDSSGFSSFLKEIMEVKTIKKLFPNDTIFDQEKYLLHLRSLQNTDSIRYDSSYGVHFLYNSKGEEYFIGIKKTGSNIAKWYFEICFYDFDGFVKGPDWWFYNDGSFRFKRFWYQTKPLKSTFYGGIKERYYFETKFFRNGHIKREGKYDNDERVGTWKFYKRNGELKKIRIYQC